MAETNNIRQIPNPESMFTIDRLNMMVYRNNYDDTVNDNEINFFPNVTCNFVEPQDLKGKIASNQLSIMSFNIRSMKQNWNNFKTEILKSGARIDIFGLCETHLTDETEGLYNVDNYNIYSTNITSNKGGVCYMYEMISNVELDLI